MAVKSFIRQMTLVTLPEFLVLLAGCCLSRVFSLGAPHVREKRVFLAR